MPSTFQALAVALLALLPGALYEIAREQRSGQWGARGADQILRLLGFSVAFQVLLFPMTYWLYSHYIVSGHLARGEAVSGWVVVLLVVYLAAPFGFGRLTAWAQRLRESNSANGPLTTTGTSRADHATRARHRCTALNYLIEQKERVLNRWRTERTDNGRTNLQQAAVVAVSSYTNASPAPRAWDHLFARPNLVGWVVLHLQDGTKIGGEWSNASYASGFPQQDSDLYLGDQVELDENGSFVMDGGDGLPRSLGKSLLIRWDEVKRLDFFHG